MKKDGSSDYLWDNFFFNNLLITLQNYYYIKFMLLTFLRGLIFFRFFVILRSTKIRIVLNFWLQKVYEKRPQGFMARTFQNKSSI